MAEQRRLRFGRVDCVGRSQRTLLPVSGRHRCQDGLDFIPKRRRVSRVRLTPTSYTTSVITRADRLITTYFSKALISHCTTWNPTTTITV